MTGRSWLEAPLDRRHDRAGFDCGEPDLNLYLLKFALQNHRKGGAKSFVAYRADEPERVLAFYSLSPASLDYGRTPEIARRGLGRYEVPVFRLGRLTVSRVIQGRGLGGQVLLAAGERCLAVAEQVGGVAMLIDAKSEPAARWYESYGATRLADAPLSLVLPLATIRAALLK